MGVFHATIKSAELLTETEVTVILPQDSAAKLQKPLRTLYLLHGMGRNHTTWLHDSNIHQYASQYKMAVIMPEVRRNLYCDMAYGRKFFSWISGELPAHMNKTLHIPAEPSQTYIAGRSVGGYGALKCAFTFPNRYAGAASFSGTVHLPKAIPLLLKDGIMSEAEIQGNLGEAMTVHDENDLLVLAEKAPQVRIFQSCGTEDFLLENNRLACAALTQNLSDYRYEELPGAHDAVCFDASLKRALQFFFGEEASV